MDRAFYSDTITNFLPMSTEELLGKLAINNTFALERTQRDAWIEEIKILQKAIAKYQGSIYFEFSIPRLGQRIDVVLIIGPVVFVLEFKVGEKDFTSNAFDQVWDYALDLKNFHEPSHELFMAPVLIASHALPHSVNIQINPQNDNLLFPIKCNQDQLGGVIQDVLKFANGECINQKEWDEGRYCPTPTIIEAAMALYNSHSVAEISRSDASAINLSRTSEAVSEIIRFSKNKSCKSICFVTGVPGAGKTLVGLNIATAHMSQSENLHSVFLSGNGPLVAVLREALTRDRVFREKEKGVKIKKKEAFSEVKSFIQNVHNFRDEYLIDPNAPFDHVALFDEAQRAWNLEQTSDFMRRKKNKPGFNYSEPEFLISCLDRHPDWAVIVCLVGGGQEINTGEAGIMEWIDSLNRAFPDWRVYISSRLVDEEYRAQEALIKLQGRENVFYKDDLHLSVSMRSFRAENVSLLVKQILDLDPISARSTLELVKDRYPIVLTRDIKKAKRWLKDQARGSERYGIVVSSQAYRLKPHAIDVRSPVDPVHYFLHGKEDVRSSYYLEDVATEFQIQGLELDWVCITWDGDFRHHGDRWDHWSFRGDRWIRIKQQERKFYQKNAYRVLMTRARQGMVIVVPEGSANDPTRAATYYDPTFEYLKQIGLLII
jgi:hypothetical protein